MIVVDSSAVVDALTERVGTDALVETLAAGRLHAPTLLDYEVVSSLRGLTLGGLLSASRAEDAMTDFDDLRITRWESDDALLRRAFQLRENLTVYDASYVALAEALDCPIVTRDIRLARAAEHLVPFIVR